MPLLPEDEARIRRRYRVLCPDDLDLSAIPAGWDKHLESFLEDVEAYLCNTRDSLVIEQLKVRGLLVFPILKHLYKSNKALLFSVRVFRQRCLHTCTICGDRSVAIDPIAGHGFCLECFELNQAGIV